MNRLMKDYTCAEERHYFEPLLVQIIKFMKAYRAFEEKSNNTLVIL
jgi:hypothetical protein